MTFEHPTGWIDVDFSRVGLVEPDEDGEEGGLEEVDWGRRPVLRAFLVHVRILENHQNGKDTHLRAVQLFARDETVEGRRKVGTAGTKTRASVLPFRTSKKVAETNHIKLASWMQDPDLR